MSSVDQIDPNEARERIDAGALLLDVREQHEWDTGHSADAVHVPLREIPDRLDSLPRERPIVAVCRSGARSDRAAGFLAEQGFEAVNLAGGMQAWAAAGLPIVDASGAPGAVA